MVAMLRIVLGCFLYHKQDLAYPAKFESGILAAAHLSGPGNVKKFLRNKASKDFNKKDANGTSISDYIRIFNRCKYSDLIDCIFFFFI